MRSIARNEAKVKTDRQNLASRAAVALGREITNLVREEIARALATATAGEHIPHSRWGLPRRVACALAAAGTIAAVKRGRSWFATRAEIDRYFAEAPPPVATAANDLDAMVDAAVARRRVGAR